MFGEDMDKDGVFFCFLLAVCKNKPINCRFIVRTFDKVDNVSDDKYLLAFSRFSHQPATTMVLSHINTVRKLIISDDIA